MFKRFLELESYVKKATIDYDLVYVTNTDDTGNTKNRYI